MKSLIDTFIQSRYPHFFAVGVFGTVLNLGTSYAITHWILSLDYYFFASIVGLTLNVIFNFILYTISIFKTSSNHFRRLAIFIVYSVIISSVYGVLVKILTPLFGAEYYLIVCAFLIISLSIVNFLVLKLSIFKESIPVAEEFV